MLKSESMKEGSGIQVTLILEIKPQNYIYSH